MITYAKLLAIGLCLQPLFSMPMSLGKDSEDNKYKVIAGCAFALQTTLFAASNLYKRRHKEIFAQPLLKSSKLSEEQMARILDEPAAKQRIAEVQQEQVVRDKLLEPYFSPEAYARDIKALKLIGERNQQDIINLKLALVKKHVRLYKEKSSELTQEQIARILEKPAAKQQITALKQQHQATWDAIKTAMELSLRKLYSTEQGIKERNKQKITDLKRTLVEKHVRLHNEKISEKLSRYSSMRWAGWFSGSIGFWASCCCLDNYLSAHMRNDLA